MNERLEIFGDMMDDVFDAMFDGTLIECDACCELVDSGMIVENGWTNAKLCINCNAEVEEGMNR